MTGTAASTFARWRAMVWQTTRLLQNQLRSSTKMQVLEPDRPPLHDALEQALEKLGEGGKFNRQEKEQYRLEIDRSGEPGDGYTLFSGGIATHGIAPALYSKLGYDAVRDFSPL